MSEKGEDSLTVENAEKGFQQEQKILGPGKNGSLPESRISDDKNDPLNWPYWLKVYLALTVSGLGFVNQLGSAIINPAFVVIAEDLDISVEQASYCTTVTILFMGVMPMFVVPFSAISRIESCGHDSDSHPP
jgi:hypothetical protein